MTTQLETLSVREVTRPCSNSSKYIAFGDQIRALTNATDKAFGTCST